MGAQSPRRRADGRDVPFAFYAQFDDGPVALGWLRASRRDVDEAASSEHQPVLAHRRDARLAPGEIVLGRIEIWPSGTIFRTGESLQLIVQGADINRYPEDEAPVYYRHGDSANAGRVTLYGGGDHASFLVVPMVPPT